MNKFAVIIVSAIHCGMMFSHAAEGIRVDTYVTHPPEMGCLTNYSLTTGTHRFGFLIPNGWDTRMDQETASFVLNKPNVVDQITIRRREPVSGKPATSFREELLERYKNAIVVREGVCYSEGGEGTYYDLEWVTDHERVYVLRIAKLEHDGVTLEVGLFTTPENFRRAVLPLQSLVTSFQPLPAVAASGV